MTTIDLELYEAFPGGRTSIGSISIRVQLYCPKAKAKSSIVGYFNFTQSSTNRKRTYEPSNEQASKVHKANEEMWTPLTYEDSFVDGISSKGRQTKTIGLIESALPEACNVVMYKM